MSINEVGVSVVETGKNTLSLYIHIPFCNSKCNYCAFISMVASEDDKKRYYKCLLEEIKLQSQKYRKFYSVSSIYIGGGTPSCLDYYYVRDLLSLIYKNFSVKNTAEITIEINPNSADKTKIREYILSGINRFSIGLQSTNPKILKAMGRTHTVQDFLNTVSYIKEYGIKNISADIIIGYPNQKLIDVKDTVAFLLKNQIPHISSYMLQVEDGTNLKLMIDNGVLDPATDDQVIAMYNYVNETLSKNGYERYEFSNFAKPTFQSYHNSVYWLGKDYLGLGLAAHSYIDGTRFSNTENIITYVSTIENKHEVPVDVSKALTKEEKQEEFIMLGLRTKDGVDLDKYKQIFSENLVTSRKEKIAKFIVDGYLILTENNHLVCTNKGYLVQNRIALELTT